MLIQLKAIFNWTYTEWPDYYVLWTHNNLATQCISYMILYNKRLICKLSPWPGVRTTSRLANLTMSLPPGQAGWIPLMHKFMHRASNIYVYTYTHTYIHTHTYTHTHTHTHTHTCSCIYKHTHTHTPNTEAWNVRIDTTLGRPWFAGTIVSFAF